MKLKDAMRSMGRLQAMTMAMLLSNIVMAAGLSFSIVALNSERDRLVIIPPHLDKKAVVAWESANADYLKSFGLYVATLVGSIQPRSSETIIDAVSAFMVPKVYVEFRQQALAIINDPVYQVSGAAMSFQPHEVRYESDTGRVFVMGNLLTVSAAGEDSRKVTYEMGITIREGRPWVHHFTSYDGNKPRTLEWHLARAAREDRDLPEHAKPLSMREDPLAAAQQHTQENGQSAASDEAAPQGGGE